MNLIRRAAMLKNMVGALSPTAADAVLVANTLAQAQARVETSGPPLTDPGFNSGAFFVMNTTIAARDTNATTGYTDLGSIVLDVGSSYGYISQTTPLFHPTTQATLGRLYRATAGGFIEINLGFFYSGGASTWIPNNGTGSFVRVTNLSRNIQNTFLLESVGVLGTPTLRFTMSGNLGQQGEVAGDPVRLEFFLSGG